MAWGNDKEIELQGVILGETPKSWIFESDNMTEKVFVPKSQCRVVMDSDSDTEGRATLFVKEWLVNKNGWL